ncbi:MULTISPECIES: hypothetical protein [Metabacillus]|uniref:hypothetical protein n=1 Tax=Metabacillus TaxID=2675233 RepID=UPI000C7FD59A|nr:MULTISPECIES: hypothetical protein [Metabacillus]MCM3443953.1 hypothetical protein [Metabacillus halosaccharovorans]PMC34995.1 hypothetical protein CJ195_21035 [Bacillus sp. UMB0899]
MDITISSIYHTKSAKEMAFDTACDILENHVYVYVSNQVVTIANKLDHGYINERCKTKQFKFKNQFKLRSFLSYLKEYKNVTLLNGEAINSYPWI